MIRRTLTATQLATFSIDLPNERAKRMPAPTGTGFFVSEDGWFVTAAHVVTKDNRPEGTPRDDISEAWLMKESRPGEGLMGMCQYPRLELVEPDFDFALLKLEFGRNSDKEHLKGRTGFPFLVVSTRQLEEGEPVYAFGYPLSMYGLLPSGPNVVMGHASHCPRTTSAVVAATMDVTSMISTSHDPQVYVLDKAPELRKQRRTDSRRRYGECPRTLLPLSDNAGAAATSARQERPELPCRDAKPLRSSFKSS